MSLRTVVCSVCVLFSSVLGLSMVAVKTATAETWSDTTGKFSIEAEYAGISGSNLVLRKPDGTTLNVPISKLSPESREQAKAIYDKQQADATPAGNMPSLAPSATVSSYLPVARPLNFTPPSPPIISPMPAFPANGSLQETLDFVRTQSLAGHLEVFWDALPDDVRAVAENPEIRETLRSQIETNADMTKEIIAVVDKLTEVLVTKKPFILNSPMLAQVPPQFKPFIEQGYDPAVGLIHEYAEMSVRTEAILDASLSDYFHYHLPRLGAHAQSLVKIVPAALRDPFINSFVANQTSETMGAISFLKQDGTTQTVEMTRYNNRWLPSEFAEQWQADKDSIVKKIVAGATNGAVAAQNDPRAMASVKGMVAQASAMLDPLLAANSQQAFDTAVGQAVMPVMMMMGAMGGAPGPGAPGPGAPGPGAPGPGVPAGGF